MEIESLSAAHETPDGLIEEASIPRVGGVSLTQQVIDAIFRAIRLNAFPGGRLPPEHQLAKLLGVSRTTVRRALQSLEVFGLVERRPGRGTRLREHGTPGLVALHGLVPFPTLLRELGHEVTSKVSWRKVGAAPDDLVKRLRREVSGDAYEVDILLLADGEPAVATTAQFPADVLRRAPADEDFQAGSILLLSESCFRKKIAHAVASIEPRVSRKGHAARQAQLGLPAGRPYLLLRETFYCSREQTLAVSRVSVNPGYVTFSVFRRFF